MNALAGTSFMIALIYALTLIPVCHNIYKYLYQQSRYKIFLTVTFYVTAVIIIFCRVTSFLYLAVNDAKH